MLIKLLIAVAALFLAKFFLRLIPRKYPENEFNIQGVPVYIDKGKQAKVLVNHKFRTTAKPDFIFREHNGTETLVERKAGFRDPILADIVQVKAAVLAARPTFPKLKKAYISTKKGLTPVDVNMSDKALFKEIQQYHQIVEAINKGKYVSQTCSDKKCCERCPVSNSCRYL